jgi:hypothetical protein
MQLVSPNYWQDSILTHSIHPDALRTRKLECNAQLRRNGLTRLVSTDNISTSFLFITFDYISLHEKVFEIGQISQNWPVTGSEQGKPGRIPAKTSRFLTKTSAFLADGRGVEPRDRAAATQT